MKSVTLRERDKKSYPQLEGRIVKWTYTRARGEKERYGRVVGCDYSIGITIVDDTDPEKNLTCLLGELAPERKEKNMPMTDEKRKIYDKGFAYFLKIMRNNQTFSVDDRCRLTGQQNKGGGMVGCAFR